MGVLEFVEDVSLADVVALKGWLHSGLWSGDDDVSHVAAGHLSIGISHLSHFLAQGHKRWSRFASRGSQVEKLDLPSKFFMCVKAFRNTSW